MSGTQPELGPIITKGQAPALSGIDLINHHKKQVRTFLVIIIPSSLS